MVKALVRAHLVDIELSAYLYKHTAITSEQMLPKCHVDMTQPVAALVWTKSKALSFKLGHMQDDAGFHNWNAKVHNKVQLCTCGPVEGTNLGMMPAAALLADTTMISQQYWESADLQTMAANVASQMHCNALGGPTTLHVILYLTQYLRWSRHFTKLYQAAHPWERVSRVIVRLQVWKAMSSCTISTLYPRSSVCVPGHSAFFPLIDWISHTRPQRCTDLQSLLPGFLWLLCILESAKYWNYYNAVLWLFCCNACHISLRI